MNGLNIQNGEQFKEIYDKDPGLAFAIFFENIVDLKKHCRCQLKHCEDEFVKKSWFKTKIAFVSGVIATIAFFGNNLLDKIFNWLSS